MIIYKKFENTGLCVCNDTMIVATKNKEPIVLKKENNPKHFAILEKLTDSNENEFFEFLHETKNEEIQDLCGILIVNVFK